MKKIVLVTGASSGIGNHVAHMLSHGDYRVITIDVNPCNNLPPNVTTYTADLKDPKSLENIFSDIKHLDIAINCAGVSATRKDLTEFSGNELMQEIQSNFLVTFNAVKQEILKMRIGGKGKIINLSSISAHKGMQNFLAYSTAKAAISNLTKVAAIENARFNIHVNSISPATIDTPMIRKKHNGIKRDYSDVYYTGDCGTTGDVYSVVLMLINNSFITGSDIVLDGGLTELCKI